MRLWPPQKEAVTEEFFRLTSIWVLSSDDFDLGQIESSDHFGGGGAGGHDNGEDNDPDSIPLIFTPEQIAYAQDLDRKAASLSRSIQDLRLRLPPPDISQRLPHLHAHSLASNAALALQLNAHSATKEQVQLREVRLQEENVEYDKAISNCENKIREKLQEANAFQSKLKELDFTEKKLKFELESVQAALIANQSEQSNKLSVEIKSPNEAQEEAKDAKSALLYKLENKKQELASIEEMVQNLEKQWAKVQDDAVKKPSPVLDNERGELVKSCGKVGKKGEISEAKTMAALKSHSEAERRRRERINAHLATLRSLVPSNEKGIVSSSIAYYVQGLVMQKRGPVFVTAFSPLMMIIVAIMGSFILAEKIYVGDVLGAVLIQSTRVQKEVLRGKQRHLSLMMDI